MNASQTPLSKRNRTTRYLIEGASALLLAILVTVGVGLHFTRPPIRYSSQPASQGTTVQARVLAAETPQTSSDESEMFTLSQELTLEILSPGAYQGEEITLTYNGIGPSPELVSFQAGEKALVRISQRPDGGSEESLTIYAVADHVRLLPLGILAGVFCLATVFVGRWQGLRALLGLGLTALLIGGFILPQILAHRDPVTVTLIGAALLLGLTLYLIQGWNLAGHTAFLSMLISLLFTGLLAILWTHLAHMTGFGSEETMYLQSTGVTVEMRGLLLAGIILGAAGVLDDVVLAQAVAVFEFTTANPTLDRSALYRHGMEVGIAHLTSMVNTLFMAYASVALPLIILFYLYAEPWYLTLNRELIAEEVLRTLIGSLGLMGAVPLTTLFAAWVAPLASASSSSQSNQPGR